MAEFLILARELDIQEPVIIGDDKADAQAQGLYDVRLRKGDIITCRNDGVTWGGDECLPRFHVVKVPGMEPCGRYEIFLWDGDADEPLATRKYAIAIQDTWDSVVTMTETEFLTALITKTK